MTRDPDPTSASSRSHVATFSDPEVYALATVSMAAGAPTGRFLGSIRGPFQAKTTRLILDQVSVGTGRASVPVTFSTGIPAAHVFVFATEPAAARRISGWTVGRQHIFHHRPNEQAVASSPSGQPWPSAVVAVPFDVMAEHGPAVTGFAADVPLNDDRLFLAPEASLARLVSLVSDAARLAEASPWIAAAPGPARALSGALIEALLACVTQGRARRDRAALRRHRQIVARLDEVMRERPEEMLSLRDLCAEMNVAERTLNLACMEFLGQGAMRYARARRLEHVRRALLTSDPVGTTVTGLAMRYGFWELGRFAQAYRQRFGERPSETLGRAPV